MTTQPTVLITGASSGIGLAAAKRMQDLDWQVFATARKPEDLEMLSSEQLNPVELDVSDPDSVATAAETVLEKTDGRLTGLVNNAGYGQPGALEDISREQMRTQFEVNVFGLLDLTNRLLPAMISNGRGRLVHVSSVVGRVALPFMGIYSASKFAVEALADIQRVELVNTGLHVSLVEPGPITTRFTKNAVQAGELSLTQEKSRFADLYRKELQHREERSGPKPFALPPEAVAKKIEHALTANRPHKRYKVTFPAYLGAVLSRVAPDALIDGILKQELRKRQGR